MLGIIVQFLLTRQRAKLSQELEHVYADMRRAKENTRMAKLYAEQTEEKTLAELRVAEKKLVNKVKALDTQDLNRSIPTRSARAW